MRSIGIVEGKENDPSNRRNNSPAMRRCRPDHHLLFTPDRATLRSDMGARPPLSLLRNRTSRALNPSPSAPPVNRSCAMSASRVKQHIQLFWSPHAHAHAYAHASLPPVFRPKTRKDVMK